MTRKQWHRKWGTTGVRLELILAFQDLPPIWTSSGTLDLDFELHRQRGLNRD